MTTAYAFRRRTGSRRGSTILLVISVLSLLVLLAVGLSFTSRMELSTAKNFGDGVQNRVAALTGVAGASEHALKSLPSGALGPLDLGLEPEFLAARAAAAAGDDSWLRERIADGRVSLAPLDTTATADVGLLDASARINVNAADVDTLERFFAAASSELNLSIDARAAAAAIDAVRLGGDGTPGFRGLDDDRDASGSLASWSYGAADSPLYASMRPGARIPRGTYNGIDDSAVARDIPYLGLRTGADTPQGGSRSIDDAGAARPTYDHMARGAATPPGAVRSIDAMAGARVPERALAADAERAQTRRALLTGIDESDEYVADIRLEAHGDDLRFGSLRDLLDHPEIVDAGLDEKALDALEPLMTVFSTSVREYVVDGEPRPVLDLNRASETAIFEALAEHYGDVKNPILLRQFALNVVDARDGDSVPTVWVDPYTGEWLGVERTPFLTEVWPDSTTPPEWGDDGQFVEIFNPWDEELSVDGWRLEGSAGIVPLDGVVAPGGYLVVTDDVDGRLDPDTNENLPGTGSLYDIFGVLADRTVRRAIERPEFDIPDQGDIEIRLVDRDGNLIDRFAFRVQHNQLDDLYSYQRINPLVRSSWKLRATPFGQAPRPLEPMAEDMARLTNYPPDGPFASPADVLNVFAGFANPKESKTGVTWGFPVVGTPRSADSRTADLAAHSSTVDGRVLDIFDIEFREYPNQFPEQDAQGLKVSDIPASWVHGLRPGVRHGRVNLNTAPALVLGSLPGTSPSAAERVVERRERLIADVRAGRGGDGVLYARPSDVLVDDDLLGAPKSGPERLGRFRSLWEGAALNSRAFVLVGQPRAGTDAESGLRKATRTAAIVALDRGVAEHVAGWNLYQ